MRIFLACMLGTLAACTFEGEEPVPSGKKLYENNCAGCHGPSGKGDGPIATQLSRPPADLTRLTVNWQGFPRSHVMGYVHGYHRKGSLGEVMPTFDESLEEPMILYDIGDGIPTPTPLRLVRIADYIKTLQDESACSSEAC